MRLARPIMLAAALALLAATAVAQTEAEWANPATYDAIWAKPDHGWNELIARSKHDPLAERRVRGYVMHQLQEAWKTSLASNGYQPIRDLIAELYQAGEKLGEDKAAAHALLYQAAADFD